MLPKKNFIVFLVENLFFVIFWWTRPSNKNFLVDHVEFQENEIVFLAIKFFSCLTMGVCTINMLSIFINYYILLKVLDFCLLDMKYKFVVDFDLHFFQNISHFVFHVSTKGWKNLNPRNRTDPDPKQLYQIGTEID